MESSDNIRKRNGKDNGEQLNKKPKIFQIEQNVCWFCLSSPHIEEHLIIKIGEHFYMALAKGPINDFHVLILTIKHLPAASQLNDDAWKELLQFKNALRKFFESQQQVVTFTERNYKSPHLQINAFGIDKDIEWKIQHAFEDKSDEFNLDFQTLSDLNSPKNLPPLGPYFVAELPNGTIFITRKMKRFPIHFDRDVFCSENLLNCEEKINWRDCVLDKDAENNLVLTFKKKFAKYNFKT